MKINNGKYDIKLENTWCGEDVSISIFGGNRPHIGAVAVAMPRKSLKGDGSISSSASVICIPGHKEDELARKVALRISKALNCVATVSVGIHLDEVNTNDFDEIENTVTTLVDVWLSKREERIIIVDEKDQELGSIEKMEAHYKGILHRAFSILVFNENNELLLQRRALSKYHTPGLWTNTCCSHPRFEEQLSDAVKRRLVEEMGFTCDLEELFHFVYKVEFEKDLFEHELDHVFVGRYQGEINPNPEEVHEIRWINLEALKQEIVENPERFTYWFKYLLANFPDKIEKYLGA